MRWRHWPGCEFIHVPGKDNVLADSLSRHPIEDPDVKKVEEVAELLAIEPLDEELRFPIQLSTLREAQVLERQIIHCCWHNMTRTMGYFENMAGGH